MNDSICGSVETTEKTQECGLARSISTDQAHDLTGMEVDADVRKSRNLTEGLGDPDDAKQRISGRIRWLHRGPGVPHPT